MYIVAAVLYESCDQTPVATTISRPKLLPSTPGGTTGTAGGSTFFQSGKSITMVISFHIQGLLELIWNELKWSYYSLGGISAMVLCVIDSRLYQTPTM